ncbi:ANTAR domain-containing protein [Streptomyces sp. NBC_00435]|uniref:ANTAR domain-containing protein n=1 Tax=Streptomyces sp. NBC_00435 TaxID=2903649 RepID=UPI002E2283C4
MISDAMAEILDLLQAPEGPRGVADADIASAAADALAMDGLAVSLVTGGDRTELVWCTDGPAREFQDLQLTLGEGPEPEAVRTGAMVWAPDLAQAGGRRWPALGMEAPALEASAVFCFPMVIGAIKVGVLTAVRRTAGPLTEGQADDALALATALTVRFLNREAPQSEGLNPLDSLGDLQHAVVHQATGMLSVQLALSLPHALLRLRAHAYSSGRSITSISKDIVDRRLRLDHPGNGEGASEPFADKD